MFLQLKKSAHIFLVVYILADYESVRYGKKTLPEIYMACLQQQAIGYVEEDYASSPLSVLYIHSQFR